MFKSTLIVFIVTFSLSLQAQDNNGQTIDQQKNGDSIRAAVSDYAALMYPRIRQFTITHEENGQGNIISKNDGKEFFEGSFRSSTTKINFNLPVLNRKNNLLVTSIGVVHQFYELTNVKSLDQHNTVPNSSRYIPMLSAGISYSRAEKLFGKQVSFTGFASGLFNPSLNRSQFTFTGIALVPVIQKKDTRLSVGGVLLIDPASPVPFFLMASYFHKFRSWDMDLMIDLPYRAALRKPIGKKSSISFTNEMGGTNSFFDFGNSIAAIPSQKLTMSSLNMKSGFLAEYRISKKAVVSLSAGVNYMVNSKIREGNSRPKDYFLENKHKPVPYVQLGFSLLPFWKGLNL